MSELQFDSLKKVKNFSLKNFSYFGLISCLLTLILAFLFKDYLVNLLAYLEEKSTTNIVEFHLILFLLYVGVSLPILWGYLICILICSYVYSFMNGFLLVVFYSALGMSVSFFICRYMFYECSQQRVKSVSYLQAISSIIESNDKGFQIIFLSRIMPIPFGLVNTLFSVTNVKFIRYMVASLVGLMPTQLILCYMGSTLKSMSDVLVNQETARTASLVLIVQLFIAIGAMYYILHAAKIELDKHISKQSLLNNSLKNGSISSVSSHPTNKSLGHEDDLDKVITTNECENEHLLNLTIKS